MEKFYYGFFDEEDPILKFTKTITEFKTAVEKLERSVEELNKQSDRIFGNHVLVKGKWIEVEGITKI